MTVFPFQASIQLPTGGARVFEWTLDPLMGSSGAATALAFSGPSTGTVGVTTSNFTVAPNGTYTGTITPSDSGAGGTFVPSSLAFTGGAGARTFTYLPIQAGILSISISSNPSLTITGSPVLVNVGPGPGTIIDMADPRQGTILNVDTDIAGVDPRQGTIIA